MKGRKPELVNTNSIPLPLHEEPTSVHYAKAKSLRPDDLNDTERKIWDRVAPHLAMLGRLKPHFVDALSEYCRVIRRIMDARKYLDEDDWTYVSQGRQGTQYKSRPEVAQLNDDWRKWRSLVGEFGLAPAAERGMNDVQGDIFSEFENYR